MRPADFNLREWFRFDYNGRMRYGRVENRLGSDNSECLVVMEAYNVDGVPEGFKSFMIEKMANVVKVG